MLSPIGRTKQADTCPADVPSIHQRGRIGQKSSLAIILKNLSASLPFLLLRHQRTFRPLQQHVLPAIRHALKAFPWRFRFHLFNKYLRSKNLDRIFYEKEGLICSDIYRSLLLGCILAAWVSSRSPGESCWHLKRLSAHHLRLIKSRKSPSFHEFFLARWSSSHSYTNYTGILR